jgi:hypothetical protein
MNKLRAAAKLVPILVVCLFGQGCVGVCVAHIETETYKNPAIGYEPTVNLWEWDCVRSKGSLEDPLTAAWLQEYWGKPASVRPATKETQGELWTYKFGLVGGGVIPLLIVPVPLVLPLAREKVVFLVRDGHVVSAEVKALHLSIMGFGFGPDGKWALCHW